jgi:hypothetical protein
VIACRTAGFPARGKRRGDAKLLLIVDIAGGGVELVAAEKELNLLEQCMGVVAYCCSDAMYFVRLRIRNCTTPSLFVPIAPKIGPQTGISFEP